MRKQSQPLDMDQVLPGLWLGSYKAEMSPLAELQKDRITHVLQLGTTNEMCPTHASELEYKCVPAEDFDHVDLIRMLIDQDACKFIEEGIAKGAVLVHCQLGMSRSPTAVMAFLMVREGKSFQDALVHVLKCRRSISPNPGFCQQLKGLERVKANPDQYAGPVKDFLADDQEWLVFFDHAREIAQVQ